MISEEERKAIGQCKLLLAGDITLHILDDDGGTAYAGIVNKEYNKDLETVLNLIETQNKMIDYMIKKYVECPFTNEMNFTCDECDEKNKGTCDEIIKEYFRNKAKESE